MKRVIIVHGWGGNPDEPALVWLDNKLQGTGLQVIRPAMPDPENPNIETWVAHLSKVVGTPDLDTYFVGHSIGCQTILRYLETINTAVGGAVFIAGWFTLTTQALETEEDKNIAKPWLETPIDFNKVNAVLKDSFAIFSEDDSLVPVENEIAYKEKVGARTLVINGKGHFSESDGVTEIPEVLPEILRMVNI